MSGPYDSDDSYAVDPYDTGPQATGSRATERGSVPSSEALVDDAAAVIQQQGSAFGRNLVEQVRANPVPVLLTGVGVAWLLANSMRTSRERAWSDYPGGEFAGESGDYRDGPAALRQGYEQLRNDQPLVLGAIAIAAGALIGSLLPDSDVEASYLGGYSDEAKSRVREEVEQASILVKEAAVRATEGARQAVDSSGSPRAGSGSGPVAPGSGVGP